MAKTRRVSQSAGGKRGRKGIPPSNSGDSLPSGSGETVSKKGIILSINYDALGYKSKDNREQVAKDASVLDLEDSGNLMTEGIEGLCRGSKDHEDSPLCLTPTMQKGEVSASELMEALKKLQAGDGMSSPCDSEDEDIEIPESGKREPPLLDAETYLFAEEEEAKHFLEVAKLRSDRLWSEPNPCPRKAKRLADQLRDTQKYFRRRVMLANAVKNATKHYIEALNWIPSEPLYNRAHALKVCNRQRMMYGRFVKSYGLVSELRLRAMMAHSSHQLDLSGGATGKNAAGNAV